MINNILVRLKNLIKNLLNIFQIRTLTKIHLNLIIYKSRYL